MEQPPLVPATPDTDANKQIDRLLLLNQLESQQQVRSKSDHQIYWAIGIALLFYALTWKKFGVSWADQSLLGAVIYLPGIAVGNVLQWLWHRNEPDFKVSQGARTIAWIWLFVSVLFCYFWSPASMTKVLNADTGNNQQLQQLTNDLN